MLKKDLPVWTVMDQVLDTLRKDGRVILQAPTGSGKSTQVPQAILDAGLARRKIVVVQPRRVACRSVARYVAEQRGTKVGTEVGYIVRHDHKATDATRVLFITDGILMRFLERDPFLSWADAVILDEFHERRLYMDVGLGLLREARKRRADLKLVVMSATLEIPRLEMYLDVPVIQASGTTFPVKVQHVCNFPPEWDLPRRVARVVARAVRTLQTGHVLVFLPGKEEIQRTAARLERFRLPLTQVIPLHSELKPKEQDRIFDDSLGQKIILTTNIAETSLTIPGVKLVIDTGLERRSSVDVDTGESVLSLTRISQNSAAQRAGRAGRTAHGTCIRMWSEAEHRKLAQTTLPEIERLDVGSVILTLKSVGIGNVAGFPFLHPPSMERLESSAQLLRTLGALDEKAELTKIGWRMLRLPLTPRYARIVVEAERNQCLSEVASIAALMAGRPIFHRPRDHGQEADESRRLFLVNDSSDFYTLLETFRRFKFNYLRPRWAREHFLSFEALHEARLLRRKILKVCFFRGSRWNLRPADHQAVTRSLVAGFTDHVVRRTPEGRWRLPTGLFADPPAWSVVHSPLAVVADVRLHIAYGAERRYASLLTAVEPDTLAQLGVALKPLPHEGFSHRPLDFTSRFAHLLPIAERLAKE